MSRTSSSRVRPTLVAALSTLALALGGASPAAASAPAAAPDDLREVLGGYVTPIDGEVVTRATFVLQKARCGSQRALAVVQGAALRGPTGLPIFGATISSGCWDPGEPEYMLSTLGSDKGYVKKPFGPRDRIVVELRPSPTGSKVIFINRTKDWRWHTEADAATNAEYRVSTLITWTGHTTVVPVRDITVDGTPVGELGAERMERPDSCGELSDLEDGRAYRLSVFCG